jgi:NAD(P)-dependent dehydrogenase (short-subunit alcohol dehydrogenase family)
MGLPFRSIYCASKFAVEGLTESLRTEIARFNIQVCSVQPGDIRTDLRSNRVSHVPPDSHYQPELSHIEKMVDSEVNQGIDPEMVALLVNKLISKRKLQSKYVVAKPFQKFGSSLKRFLPNSIFEILLMNKYQLK